MTLNCFSASLVDKFGVNYRHKFPWRNKLGIVKTSVVALFALGLFVFHLGNYVARSAGDVFKVLRYDLKRNVKVC